MFSLSRTRALTNIIMATAKNSWIPIQTRVFKARRGAGSRMGGGGGGVAGDGVFTWEETPVWYAGLNLNRSIQCTQTFSWLALMAMTVFFFN
jgi:hypothetical protein